MYLCMVTSHDNASLGKRVPRRLTLPECKTVLRLAGESCSSHSVSKCAVVYPHRTGHGWLHWCTLLELHLTTWQWTRTVQLVDCSSTMRRCRQSRRSVHWRRLVTGGSFKKVLVLVLEISIHKTKTWKKNCRETALKQDCVSRLNITAFNTLQVLTVYR